MNTQSLSSHYPFHTLFDQTMQIVFGPLLKKIYENAQQSASKYEFTSKTYFHYDSENIEKYPLLRQKIIINYEINYDILNKELSKLCSYITHISNNTLIADLETFNNYCIIKIIVTE